MRIFGNQIDFVAKVIDAKLHPVDAGADDEELRLRLEYAQEYSALIMQVIVSFIILISCFYLIIIDSEQATQKGCFSLIGLVGGYWLR